MVNKQTTPERHTRAAFLFGCGSAGSSAGTNSVSGALGCSAWGLSVVRGRWPGGRWAVAARDSSAVVVSCGGSPRGGARGPSVLMVAGVPAEVHLILVLC